MLARPSDVPLLWLLAESGCAERLGPLASVLRTRLGALSWEVEATWRKSSWSARRDRGSPETDARLRAPGHFDGRVFLSKPGPKGE